VNTAPIVPALLAYDGQGVPMSAEYRDIYHPRSGAFAQAGHVFLDGNGLPGRWQGRERFVILETGFGLGNNFLATWQAWRSDPQRCARLVYLSIEKHPLVRTDLERVHRGSALAELAATLHAAWPPLTHNLHRLGFDDGAVQLLLALGDVQAWLPELVAEVDAFYLDGYAPDRNPRMWDERVCKALGRLAAPGATLATWSAAGALRAHLTSAGFTVRRAPGSGGKRDITLATFAPRHPRRRPPARSAAGASATRHAMIVGGGLAGCATAWALGELGWHSTVLERRPQLAAEASGNPAGLFHGIVNAHDGVHARFNRAAALAIRAVAQAAIDQHGVAGSVAGMLRLETRLEPAAMRALLEHLALPPDYVQALDAAGAAERSGLPVTRPAWFYPGGGWIQPAALANTFLAGAGARVECRHGVDVRKLRRIGDRWQLIDADGQVIVESATVVLANAHDALRLLGRPPWPIDRVRGQLTWCATAAMRMQLPSVPIAGAGYLLPEIDGQAIFGATAQVDDDDPSVRPADHLFNLAQLERLTGRRPLTAPHELHGRTAWRCSSRDRLPVIGAVPDAATLPQTRRLDQPRFVPRAPGLFVYTALGSRGITWSALGARLLAALVSGSPLPLESSLVDAVDPARFVSRQARRLPAR
jgi:tRNA 5-methylaminomethyl-2-thiouridine biosynthesis bifunctional protein